MRIYQICTIFARSKISSIPLKMMKYNEIKTFVFNTLNREYWIRQSLEIRNIPPAKDKGRDTITILFSDSIVSLDPMHIVLLSCIIENLKEKDFLIWLKAVNKKLDHFINENVAFKKYWEGGKGDHIDSPDSARLNLWRITDAGKEGYSISVENYFKTLFPEKDLSSLRTVLNELYFNVFDHADAKNNAFSYIYYDEHVHKIYIAVCDYGIGIAASLRKAYTLNSDGDALQMSLKSGISAKSQVHNKGFGLDVVISSLGKDNSFRIVSNKGLLKLKGNTKKPEYYNLDFDFKGTLIYFDLSTDMFPDDEELSTFSFD